MLIRHEMYCVVKTYSDISETIQYLMAHEVLGRLDRGIVMDGASHAD